MSRTLDGRGGAPTLEPLSGASTEMARGVKCERLSAFQRGSRHLRALGAAEFGFLVLVPALIADTFMGIGKSIGNIIAAATAKDRDALDAASEKSIRDIHGMYSSATSFTRAMVEAIQHANRLQHEARTGVACE